MGIGKKPKKRGQRFQEAVNRIFMLVGLMAIVACTILVFKHGTGILYPQLKYKVPQPIEWGHEFYTKGAEYEKLSRSLVKVITLFRYGSGVIVRKDEHYIYILTNYHVISMARKNVTIALLYDDKSVHLKNGKVISYDRRTDVAIVKIGHLNYACLPMVLAKEEPKVGDKVYNLANPLGFEKIYTEGRVFHINDDGLMTSITIAGGSSGSPVMNSKGELIGLVRAMLQANMRNTKGETIGMTFPSAVLCVPLKALTKLCKSTFETLRFKEGEEAAAVSIEDMDDTAFTELLEDINKKLWGDWRRHEFQKNFDMQ